jgi:hypothetical protein
MATEIVIDPTLASFDGPSLAAAAAALQLMPDNAPHLLRLQRLAAAGAALAHVTPAQGVTPTKLRSLLRRQDFGGQEVLSQEDPYDEVLVQGLTFYGGSYLVSPGMAEGLVTATEDLLRAIFSSRALPQEFQEKVYIAARTALTISDRIYRRVGLTRGTKASKYRTAPLVVPSAARLAELVSAVTFTPAQLQAILPEEAQMLLREEFVIAPAQLDRPCENDWLDDRLFIRPCLLSGDSLVVALPNDLLTALKHRIVVLSSEFNCVADLASAFQGIIRDKVVRALLRADASAVQRVERDRMMIRERLQFDTTKEIHLVVATDELTDLDLSSPWGTRDTEPLLDRLTTTFDDYRSAVVDESVEGVLHLVITDGIGRSAFFGVGDVDSRDAVLILTSSDLELILELEDYDPLALWYFTRALKNLHDSAQVMSFGTLDEYAIYRDHEHSFYLSDDPRPTFVNFVAGSGADVREEYFSRVDRHGVRFPPTSTMQEVRRRYGGEPAPIFVTEPGARNPAYVLELPSLHVWVRFSEVGEDSFAVIAAWLTEATAYWLWQIDLADSRLLKEASRASFLMVELSVPDEVAWLAADVEPGEEGPVASAETDQAGLQVQFMPPFRDLLRIDDNVSERGLVTVLVEELWRTIQRRPGAGFTVDVESLVEQIAPLGRKRMLHAVPASSDPLLYNAGLPDSRMVQEQVTAQILDAAGVWLHSGPLALSTGPIADTERGRIVNSVVGHYFEELRARVRELSGAGLLEYLCRADEALLHADNSRVRMLPFRAACFGPDSVAAQEVEKAIRESATANTASRFLIEYVAASPPGGSRTITLERYDYLLSLAAEIISRGTLSDAVRYELSNPRVSVLASGRLGVDRDDPYYRGVSTFSSSRAESIVREATGHVHDSRPRRSASASLLGEDLDTASRAEYGFTFDMLRDFAGAACDLALDAPGGVLTIQREVLIAALVKPEWPDDLPSKLVSQLSLAPRPEFLTGPDVYPWRYNRDLSYVRRPLLLRPSDDGSEVVLALRRTYMSPMTWFDAVRSGRLKAVSPEMKRFIGDARRRLTESFEEDVADALQAPDLNVRRRVKKIGGLRLQDSQRRDLGDIDVLVIAPARRMIVAVEAKDFEVARTPAELSHEVGKLVGNQKSAEQMHIRRVDWLKSHLREVLGEYGLDASQRWTVEGWIVVSERLVSPLLLRSSLPVITLDVAIDALRPSAGRPRSWRAGLLGGR